jgi:hypothetical protein
LTSIIDERAARPRRKVRRVEYMVEEDREMKLRGREGSSVETARWRARGRCGYGSLLSDWPTEGDGRQGVVKGAADDEPPVEDFELEVKGSKRKEEKPLRLRRVGSKQRFLAVSFA